MPELFTWIALLKNGQLILGKHQSFKEVQIADKKQQLKRFSLMNESTGDTLTVCLETGYFYSNFAFHSLFPHPDKNLFFKASFRIIFYKRIRKYSGNNPSFVYRYLLGWQTTIEGKNYQRIIFLNPTTLEFTIQEKR